MIMTQDKPNYALEAGGFSHSNGKKTSAGQWSQQDRFRVARLERGALCFVIDGMSSCDDSDRIAELACEVFMAAFLKQQDKPKSGGDMLLAAAREAIRSSSRFREHYRERKPGAAFAAAYLTHEGKAWAVHLGDVQGWCLRAEQWIPLTGEPHVTPGSSGLDFFLGKEPGLAEEVVEQSLKHYDSVDCVILACDGFYDQIGERLRMDLFQRWYRREPTVASYELYKAARAYTSNDNVTATVMKRVSLGSQSPGLRWPDLTWPAAAALVLIGMIWGAALALLMMERDPELMPTSTEQAPQLAPESVGAAEEPIGSTQQDPQQTIGLLEQTIVENCAQRLEITLGTQGTRFGLAYAPSSVVRSLESPPKNMALKKVGDRARRFNTHEWGVFLADFQLGCDQGSAATACFKEGNGRHWWLLDYNAGQNEWSWYEPLDCIDGVVPHGLLSKEQPVVGCRVKEANKQVSCELSDLGDL